jgi:uncharacterized protein (TIGR03083 family)
MDVPIPTSHLFAELQEHLLTLLRSLEPADWRAPTVCSQWTVKDIASHLLDGACRRLSTHRDGYLPETARREFASGADLVAYLTQLNADWTVATRRLSPRVLIELLEAAGDEVVELFQAADPWGPATFPVAWAGEAESLMWFDIAREYTERWHHQRQIALAVDRATPIDARRLYHPVLETFCRALPHTFRGVAAEKGNFVRLNVMGEAGGRWDVQYDGEDWRPASPTDATPTAEAVIGQDVAWRVLTKRMSRDEVLRKFPAMELHGDARLAGRVLEMVSIMA